MSTLPRTDTSVLGRWWWTVDRWMLAAIAVLVAFGAVLILAASPAVAVRIGLDPFALVRRQLTLMPFALLLMLAISLLTPAQIRRLAMAGFVLFLVLVALTLVMGSEIKGARRWIHVGVSIQPSEFLKPCFAVVAAWLFARQKANPDFPGRSVATALYFLIVTLLINQPDLGMTVVVSAVWLLQFFLAGLPLVVLAGFLVAGMGGLVGAYLFLPHVTLRVDRFFNPDVREGYQVRMALDAFMHGGVFGRGPGEGTIKAFLPDAHSDFIFAVCGEEFGMIACAAIVLVFAFIVLRGYSRMFQEKNLFILLATAGLVTEFGLQACVNMASSLHMMPTKGMTLPFISYGGSSLVALSLTMGMVLALTRKRVGAGENQ